MSKYSGKAGCENPATAMSTPVKGGGSNLGVKTWSTSAVKLGYTSISKGSVSPAKVGLNTGKSMGGKQKVK